MSKKQQDIEGSEAFMGCSSKRTKTSKTTHSQSSNVHVEIGLNDDESIEVPRATRPMGRDQAK